MPDWNDLLTIFVMFGVTISINDFKRSMGMQSSSQLLSGDHKINRIISSSDTISNRRSYSSVNSLSLIGMVLLSKEH